MESGTTARQTEPRWAELESLMGAAYVRAAGPADAVDGVGPSRVVAPDSNEQVSELLKWAGTAGIAVGVRGGGTKIGWGNTPRRLDLLLSMGRFNGMTEHTWEDLVFTVKAGTTVAAVQSELGRHRQRFALDPLWAERSTVGGVIATNDSGALRVRYGSVRDLILGVTIALPSGTIARSGGKVVKNVAGYDLPKLLTGSFGTLGVITEATFRAHPLPQSERTLRFEFADLEAANRFMLAIGDSTLVPTGMQLRSGDGNSVVDVRFEGIPVGVEAQCAQVLGLAQGARAKLGEEGSGAREELWEGSSPAVVAKFSVLPSRIAAAAERARKSCARATCVIQSTGIGMLRGESDSLEHLASSLAELRKALQEIEGTMVLLEVPLELKREMDVFGPERDSWPLMRRIKQRFDPAGTLNPGRFAGGI
jgi:glycolate dehydrogenase FAD-binding subunit